MLSRTIHSNNQPPLYQEQGGVILPSHSQDASGAPPTYEEAINPNGNYAK